MTAPPRHARDWRSDASAALGVMESSFLALLILVPIGLFALLWMYLKRVAPEGTVPEAVAEGLPSAVGEPARAAAKGSYEDFTSKPLPCPRCGVMTRPNLRGYETAECANCGAPIFAITQHP